MDRMDGYRDYRDTEFHDRDYRRAEVQDGNYRESKVLETNYEFKTDVIKSNDPEPEIQDWDYRESEFRDRDYREPEDRGRNYRDPVQRRSEGEVSGADSADDYLRRRERRKKSQKKERRRSSSSDRHSRDEHRHRREHRKKHSSHSRSVSRSRSRSKERRRKHRRRRNSRSLSADSNDSSYSWDGDYGVRGGVESYKRQVPNHTVMVRGLAPHLTENDIRQDLLKCGISVKDIRLIRQRDTGTSRGFAFVEFHTVVEATKWMDLKKGILLLHDQCEANLIYSLSKVSNMDASSSKSSADWYCLNCRGYNFKRRELCYKCNEPRPPEQDPSITNDISQNPTSTIMLFELDALTTEEGVLQAFQCRPSLVSIPIRSVRIPRDPLTNLSKGVCYVDSNNVADAIRLLAIISRETFDIDGRKVQAAYYKSLYSQPNKNSAAAVALAAAQWTNNSSSSSSNLDIEKIAEYSATLYAKTKEEYASYLKYYREYFRKKEDEQNVNAPNEATSDIQPEISKNATITKEKFEVAASGPSSSSVCSAEPVKSISKNVAPDPSRYQFDKSSGYYYDPLSGYYYDAVTQYYYDSEQTKFMFWDNQLKTYCPVPDNLNVTEVRSLEKLESEYSLEKDKPKKRVKEDTVKPAKNVAKEMEKWAKTLNQKKDIYYRPTMYAETEVEIVPENCKLYPIELSNEIASSSSNSMKPYQMSSRDNSYTETTYLPTLQSRRSPETFQETDSLLEIDVSMFIDESKIACLLCKRKFSSLEVLNKHTKMSDLHKQNLLKALGKTEVPNMSQIPQSSAYRDRAKERRMRFGIESEPASNSLKDLYMKVKEDIVTNYVEEPTKDGIKEDNLGNKMLQRMGWQAGQGLGKDNRGIIDPILAERRVGKLGLGLEGAELLVEDTDDRQTKSRKLTMARYVKLNNN